MSVCSQYLSEASAHRAWAPNLARWHDGATSDETLGEELDPNSGLTYEQATTSRPLRCRNKWHRTSLDMLGLIAVALLGMFNHASTHQVQYSANFLGPLQRDLVREMQMMAKQVRAFLDTLM